MVKVCTACKRAKPFSEFNRNARRTDGLQTACRACSAIRSRRYYLEHTTEHRATTRARRADRRRWYKIRLDELKAQFGCATCTERDVVCLEFHHLDPNEKDIDLARAVSDEWTWDRVLSEIRKCACLCANCHRKVHAGRVTVTEAMRCAVPK
jgi:transcription elongation factor Elf1